MLNVECSAITYIGLVRGNNEDNYYINGYYKEDSDIDTEGYTDVQPRDAYLYAVCDGMGGENYGEIASMIAVGILEKYQSTNINRTIDDYIFWANKLICDNIKKNRGTRSGTTLAILYIRDGIAISYNIGDSRVYFFRKKKLYLMSEDHTEAERMVKMGLLRQEEASRHKARNKLTQHLGIFPEEMIIEPYMSEPVKLKKGDMLMVCSDGLTDMVSDDDIADILAMKGYSTTDLVKELAEEAQANGAKDNVTIILAKVV